MSIKKPIQVGFLWIRSKWASCLKILLFFLFLPHNKFHLLSYDIHNSLPLPLFPAVVWFQTCKLAIQMIDRTNPLDNNATEDALRSFCLHKHAWKLIDNINGTKSSAIVYSITETAKANNLNPFRYLEYVLTVMKDHQEDTDYCFIEDLLLCSEQLPEICRSKTKTTNV